MPKVATTIPRFSPSQATAKAVPTAAAAMLTILLPRRTVERVRSGWSILSSIFLAPARPMLARWSILTRWRDMKAVSELEKKADSTIKNAISEMLIIVAWVLINGLL